MQNDQSDRFEPQNKIYKLLVKYRLCFKQIIAVQSSEFVTHNINDRTLSVINMMTSFRDIQIVVYLTLHLTNSIFMPLHFETFWCTKSNKFAILVHFLYFV